MKPQLAPSHDADDAPVGNAQGAQRLPHEFVLELARHRPLQACEPESHVPLQSAPASMQAPKHNFLPLGQVAPQTPLVQVALPPLGTEQGSQPVPQLRMLVSSTHC